MTAVSTSTPDYVTAVNIFYHLHLCRMDPWPDALVRSSTQMEGNRVYLGP